MDTKEPRFRDFIAAFHNHMFEAMSGGFSVPFTALGVVAAIFAAENKAALVAAVVFLTLGMGAMWFAAYRIWAIERSKVIQLDVSAKREAVRLRIAELITEGAGLRNEATDAYSPLETDEMQGWRGRITSWHNVALEELKKVSPADAEWYRTLNVVPAPEIPMAIPPWETNDDDWQAYAMHNFRLKKLEQLVSGEKGNLLVHG